MYEFLLPTCISRKRERKISSYFLNATLLDFVLVFPLYNMTGKRGQGWTGQRKVGLKTPSTLSGYIPGCYGSRCVKRFSCTDMPAEEGFFFKNFFSFSLPNVSKRLGSIYQRLHFSALCGLRYHWHLLQEQNTDSLISFCRSCFLLRTKRVVLQTQPMKSKK